ncbi:hypothetical protein FHS91_003915 [Sphingobium xanthum]|uniref:hypothetical protein n=1 Tax=Sphingobium xanthum TaxID=1387165 RepID=UPI001C8C215C|nr:hypothetical protein [Sphingobium xanthum]
MLEYLRQLLDAGEVEATIMAVGGSTQVSLKVKIEAIDEVGMVCRVKGMLGGWSEPQLRPWACVSHISFQ